MKYSAMWQSHVVCYCSSFTPISCFCSAFTGKQRSTVSFSIDEDHWLLPDETVWGDGGGKLPAVKVDVTQHLFCSIVCV